MWFGEPHPFPERGSPTGLSASEQQSYEGWSCRMSFCPSVHPSIRMELSSHCTDFHKILYLNIIRKPVGKVETPLKFDKTTGTLHEDQYTFMIISQWILRRMRNVSDKSCRENQNVFYVQ